MASFATAFSSRTPTSEDMLDDPEVSRGPIHIAAQQARSQKFLHFVAYLFFQGDMHAISALVTEKGVDFLDNSGRTPLMYAVIGNKVRHNSTRFID